MGIETLKNRALLEISGQDRDPFLQGLISNDIGKLVDGGAMYAALLSPQGKFLHDFILYRQGESIFLDTEAARIDELVKRLTLYKLRSNVQFKKRDDLHVVAAWGDDKIEGAWFVVKDPRHDALGTRAITTVNVTVTDTDNYDAHRLALGIPDGSRDIEIDRAILQESGFEQLHGVDFAKGCYVGQEVTARTKYRGLIKKTFYLVHGENLPGSGTKILAGDKEIGEMRSSQNGTGLALLRMVEVENAAISGVSLKSAENVITVEIPAWLKPLHAEMKAKALAGEP